MVDVLVVGTWLLRAALLGALFVGVRRRNASLSANALVSLAATFLPALVEVALYASRGVAVSVEGLVPFWIATAGALHMLGMGGFYESKWWWDHLTHLVSAAFVAAVVYGSLHGVLGASPTAGASGTSVAVLTLLFTFAVGVLWELVELLIHRYSEALGVESVLISYGPRDTALDLVFDVAGAALVLLLDVRILVEVANAVPSVTRWLLLAAGGAIVVGSLGSALLLLGMTRTGAGPE